MTGPITYVASQARFAQAPSDYAHAMAAAEARHEARPQKSSEPRGARGGYSPLRRRGRRRRLSRVFAI
jgi:hypothetical protein